MRVEDVPTAPSEHFDRQRKAVYATDGEGRLKLVATGGGELEELVTLGAVDHFAQLAQQARADARAGRVGTLAFHMYARRMDPPTLAQTAGLMTWRVRRHLRKPFDALPARLQARYAQALGMTVAQLARLEEVAE